MTKKLSIVEQTILRELSNGPMGPVSLGLRLGFNYEKASSSVTRPLKKLVDAGLIKREETNKRVVRYSLVN